MNVVTAEDASVFPDSGSIDGSHDAIDGLRRVRIKPIDTKLQLHFKGTQASDQK